MPNMANTYNPKSGRYQISLIVVYFPEQDIKKMI